MVGIYKITSPTGKVYIGQAVDIKRRWAEHKLTFRTSSNSFSRLYKSFYKHGVDSHTFEVIEECLEEELNRRERYWQDLYEVTTQRGLNCNLQAVENRSGKLAKEVIEQRQKTRMLNGGYNFSEEWRKKQSLAKKGKAKTKEHVEKVVQARREKKVGYKPVADPDLKLTFDSIKQAAEYFNCTRDIIYGRIKKGSLIYTNHTN